MSDTDVASPLAATRSRSLDLGLALAFGALALYVLGGDPRAAYPAGDGGFFYAICRTIVAHGFAYPSAIDFNGHAIPFSYSPLAFYAVAALAVAGHLDTFAAMNLWVCAWEFTFGIVSYVLGRTVFRSVHQGCAVAALIVLNTDLVQPLAMGGGITRLPGLTLAAACIAAAYRFSERPAMGVPAAVLAFASILTGWFHMEFFALSLVGTAVIFVRYRVPLRACVGVFAAIGAGSLPWLLLGGFRVTAMLHALSTSHMGSALPNTYLALNVFGIGEAANDIGLLGFLAAIAAAFAGAWEFLAAAVLIVLLDSRAGTQVDHLWFGLAGGRFAGAAAHMLRSQTQRLAAIVCAVLAFDAFLGQARASSSALIRVSDQDVADMRWMASHLPADAKIVTVSLPFLGDGRREWVPEIARRTSPNVFEGLEWVDVAEYRARAELAGACGQSARACLTELAARRLDDVFVYVLRINGRSGRVGADLLADKRFRVVHESDDAVVLAFASYGG